MVNIEDTTQILTLVCTAGGTPARGNGLAWPDDPGPLYLHHE